MQFGRRYISRNGSASLVVLGVVTVCLALLTGTQASLTFSAARQRIRRNNQALRAACILGLREGMLVLQDDQIPAFDDSREAWAQPMNFLTSNATQVRVQISDALSKLNVNRLAQPVSPAMVRTPEDMLSDLFEYRGMPVDRQMIRQLAKTMREEEIEIQAPLQLVALEPALAESLPFLLDDLCALPPPQTGSLPLNLNTVRPAVLSAMVGPQLEGWVRTVVSTREASPIPSVNSLSSGFPVMVQNLLNRALDVRSDFFEIRVTAQRDNMEKGLTAVVHRDSANSLRVIRCRW